jgi:hypothetical protein
MITHEINLSRDSTIAPVAESFHLDPADRDAMGRFVMGADELVAELQSGANLSRPELQAAMQAILQASLIGAGMAPIDARGCAFDLLHNGVGSFERARQIVLRILA